jgi:hypothetical protein
MKGYQYAPILAFPLEIIAAIQFFLSNSGGNGLLRILIPIPQARNIASIRIVSPSQ